MDLECQDILKRCLPVLQTQISENGKTLSEKINHRWNWHQYTCPADESPIVAKMAEDIIFEDSPIAKYIAQVQGTKLSNIHFSHLHQSLT